MDEREDYKKSIAIKEITKKEEEDLCGPRLTKKIDDFIFSVSVEAGLADVNNAEESSYGQVNYANVKLPLNQT